jgi:hypothetical protein
VVAVEIDLVVAYDAHHSLRSRGKAPCGPQIGGEKICQTVGIAGIQQRSPLKPKYGLNGAPTEFAVEKAAERLFRCAMA